MFRPLVIGGLLSAGLLLWVATGVAATRRDAPGADLLAVVTGLLGAGSGAIAATAALAGGSSSSTAVVAVAVCLALVVPLPWLLFTLAYTGRTELIEADATVALAVLPTAGVAATAVLFGAQFAPGVALPAPDRAGTLVGVAVGFFALLQRFALLYAGGLTVVGTGLLVWTFRRYDHLDSAEGILLGVVGTVPWASLLAGLDVGTLALPLVATFGLSVGGVAATAALTRYDPFETVPAAGNVGPATVVEKLGDVVLVTDADGTVVEVNEAAERALDVTPSDVVGGDVASVVGVPLAGLRRDEPVPVRTATGRRLFEPTVSALTDQHGTRLGAAVVLRDVTERTTRRQRLEVLNRVLRHNLRNEMNVIMGRAEELRRRVDAEELTTQVDAIVASGRTLTAFAEEARDVDRRLRGPDRAGEPRGSDGETESVRLAAVVERALERLPEDRPVRVERSVPADVLVEGGPGLLDLAVSNLVENAVVHNDASEPLVGIAAEYDPDRPFPLRMSVRDDGPGIPDGETRVLETGDETALEHGSGMGLWAVRWAVTRLGGELDFRAADPGGTVVDVRLPEARRRPEATDDEGSAADPTDVAASADTGAADTRSTEAREARKSRESPESPETGEPD